MDGVKTEIVGDKTTEQIRARVKEESRDGTIVEAYEWTHETPDRELSAEEVWDMCCRIRMRFQDAITKAVEAKTPVPNDASIRDQLIREDPEIALFARPNDHKGAFLLIADRKTTVENLTQLTVMLQIRTAQENRQIMPKQAEQLTHGFLKGILKIEDIDKFLVDCAAQRERRKTHDPKAAVRRVRGRK